MTAKCVPGFVSHRTRAGPPGSEKHNVDGEKHKVCGEKHKVGGEKHKVVQYPLRLCSSQSTKGEKKLPLQIPRFQKQCQPFGRGQSTSTIEQTFWLLKITFR